MSQTLVGQASNSASTGTTVSVTHGLTIAANDVVIALVNLNGSAARTLSDNNGGTAFTQDLVEGGSSPTRVYQVWSRVAGASEPASYNFNASSSDRWSIILVVRRGVDVASIYDVAPSVASSKFSSGSPWSANSITTSNDNSLAIAWWVADAINGTASAPSNGYGDLVTVDVDMTSACTSKVITPAGATGTTEVTNTNVSSYSSIHFALNEAIVNTDPVLDTPQSDIEVQVGQIGSVLVGDNFSDANPGDTLTFSISPNINAVTGFTFNTTTGAVIYDGSQVVGAAVSYTVEADDGGGGTLPTTTFDVTVIAPQFIIDSATTTTPDAGGTVTLALSNELATVTASCSAGAMTGVYSSGEFILDIPNPPDFGDKTLTFNSSIVVTLSDGTTTDTYTIAGIQVPSGELFSEITDIDVDGIYFNDTGLVVGDFVHIKEIVGDIIIDPATGLYSANPSANVSFSYSLFDLSTGNWSDDYLLVSYTAESVAPVITLIGADPIVWVQGTTWSDPGATVTDNIDATRTVVADVPPNVNTVGSYTLTYNATDVAGNPALPITRVVNVVSADSTPDAFTFTDVSNGAINTLYEDIQSILGVDAGQTLVATGDLLLSNDGGSTFLPSVQMITGQTLVKATLTTSGVNGLAHSATGTVNGVADTFTVTTLAAVTVSFSILPDSALVDQAGALVDYTVPIVEAWTASPEEGGTVVESWVNIPISGGLVTVSGSTVVVSTDYLLVFRSAGDVPTSYYRTLGQFV